MALVIFDRYYQYEDAKDWMAYLRTQTIPADIPAPRRKYGKWPYAMFLIPWNLLTHAEYIAGPKYIKGNHDVS